ncbi:MAG: glycosyl hydrolase 53 family protein [Candidatus Eisenbacteria bacterium]
MGADGCDTAVARCLVRARLLMLAAAVVCSLVCCCGKNAHRAGVFLLGGDISMVAKFEELGATYRDNGREAGVMRIMLDHGCNCFRVRLFVNPPMIDAVIQDLSYVAAVGKRIKSAGAIFLLDIHYSDTWADPGHQAKPVEWEGLDFAALENRVELYTAHVIATLKEAGCLPDIIQVGNEITPGFLWPDGKLDAQEGGWRRFAALLKAGIRGAREPLDPNNTLRVMVHIDRGGDAAATGWFLRRLREENVEYDLLGLSYYPWWHGSMGDLRDNLHRTAEAFGKDIMIVETAYPWRPSIEASGMYWEQTPGGQKQFLRQLIQVVRATPDGHGRGVLWWYPEAIPVRGLNVWKGGAAALFDTTGSALPALDAFSGE